MIFGLKINNNSYLYLKYIIRLFEIYSYHDLFHHKQTPIPSQQHPLPITPSLILDGEHKCDTECN